MSVTLSRCYPGVSCPQITKESLPAIDLMIAIGVIIMVLGFLGCCGAIRENRCLLLLVGVDASDWLL